MASKWQKFTMPLVSCVILSACAGRDATPIAVTQPTDISATCDNLKAEMAINEGKISSLQKEEENKRAQNIIAGSVGAVLFFPVLFAMDFKDAAGTERKALQDRNVYLGQLAAKACSVP